MKGYKGTNLDMTCQGHKFKIGKTYEDSGEIKLCEKGFHFCEYPLDVLQYYSPSFSKFFEVEADGVSEEKSGDSKKVCKKISLKVELSLSSLIEAAVKFVFEKADWSNKTQTEKEMGAASATGVKGAASATGWNGAASATGEGGAASATGEGGAASATGWNGAASATGEGGAALATGWNGAASATGEGGAASATGEGGAALATGWRGAASAMGEEGVACAHGFEGRAKASLGNWIVLSEWENKDGKWKRTLVKAFQVDGKKIKADTYYFLKDGKAKIWREK